MPYRTERGVTTYHDRDTPSEYATSRDEDAARFNEARDEAFKEAVALSDAIDNLYGEPIPEQAAEMDDVARQLKVLLARVKTLKPAAVS